MRHGTHVWLYCGQKGTDPNAISSNLPLTVLCQWNTKTVPWNSNPWNSKVEYDNRGIARVLFHGFGAIPRVLVSSVCAPSPPTSHCTATLHPRLDLPSPSTLMGVLLTRNAGPNALPAPRLLGVVAISDHSSAATPWPVVVILIMVDTTPPGHHPAATSGCPF